MSGSKIKNNGSSDIYNFLIYLSETRPDMLTLESGQKVSFDAIVVSHGDYQIAIRKSENDEYSRIIHPSAFKEFKDYDLFE